jgi:hypothetical protein
MIEKKSVPWMPPASAQGDVTNNGTLVSIGTGHTAGIIYFFESGYANNGLAFRSGECGTACCHVDGYYTNA